MQEMEECTFKPVINGKSQQIAVKKRTNFIHASDASLIPDEFHKYPKHSSSVTRSSDQFYQAEIKFRER